MKNEDVLIEQLRFAKDMIIKFANEEEIEGINRDGTWMSAYSHIADAITALKSMGGEK